MMMTMTMKSNKHGLTKCDRNSAVEQTQQWHAPTMQHHSAKYKIIQIQIQMQNTKEKIIQIQVQNTKYSFKKNITTYTINWQSLKDA